MNMTPAHFALRWVTLAAAGLLIGQLAAAGDHGSAKRIQGVWNVRVNITNCLADNVPGPIVFASFNAMNIFLADGAFLDENSAHPSSQSAHFGYWRHIRENRRGNRYEFAQRFFTFDAAGVSTGWRIVRHTVVLGPGGMNFTSAGTVETYDNDGLLLATGCSTSSALRFE